MSNAARATLTWLQGNRSLEQAIVRKCLILREKEIEMGRKAALWVDFHVPAHCGSVCTVDGEKRIGRGESRPLVAVEKWMVLREALPESGRFLNQVAVVPAARSGQG